MVGRRSFPCWAKGLFSGASCYCQGAYIILRLPLWPLMYHITWFILDMPWINSEGAVGRLVFYHGSIWCDWFGDTTSVFVCLVGRIRSTLFWFADISKNKRLGNPACGLRKLAKNSPLWIKQFQPDFWYLKISKPDDWEVAWNLVLTQNSELLFFGITI